MSAKTKGIVIGIVLGLVAAHFLARAQEQKSGK